MSIQDSINLGFRNRWSSLKRLNNAITSVLLSKSSRNVHELESLLQHHKPDLISLASNPPRNNQHKQLVQNASKDGITIVMQQRSHKEILSREIVEEALLMADMFDLNELICLELIITGERQMPRYPGAARGPVAVMLYYDSKRTVLQIMKLLLQGLGGRTWSANFPKEVQKLVSSFVLALQAEGIVGKALERLEKIDTKTEFEILQKNKALGPVKFKKQVFDFIIDIKELYADLIFSFFAQYDASSLDLQRLVKLLATTCDLSSRGSLEKISTTLLMSLLYAIEVSGLQNLERSEAAAKQYPAVKFDTLIKDALDATARQSFKIVGITSVIDFAAGISLKTLNKYAGKVETGEDVIDRALEANAFEAISRILAKNPYIRDDEFYSRRVHGILMDFQFVFPDRMKDMRDKGDEMGHILAMYTAEGIQPPASLDRLFEKFLHLLAEFYQKDPHHLTAEIWKNSLEDDMFAERNTTFIKFLKNTIETQLPQVIHIPVLKVLAAFARSAPFQIYNLLRHTEPSQKSSFNFDNFFRMLHIYLNSIRGLEKLPLQAGLQAGSLNPGAIINATELEILCAVLELIEAIASNDRNCALALSENQQFNCIQTLVGLLVGPVARKMKATILSCLGGIAEKTPSIALSIWLRLDVVLPKPQLAASGFASSQQQRSWQNGICIEIEDIEPRSEEYVITLSFLKAMNSLIKFVICNREPQIQGSIEYALNFIISGVFLKLDSRNYKSEDEKWELVASCLDLFAFLLEFYEPLSDSNSIRASFSLMNQILQESGLFRSIMRIIEGVTSLLEPDVAEPKVIDPIISKYMQQSLVTSLKIMTSIASKQSDFQIVISEIPGFPSAALVSVPTLFANINPRKGEADRLATLLRIVSLPFPFIQKEVLKLLRCLIVDDSSISNHCLLQLLPIKIVHEDYLFHGFVDCLSESSSLRLEALLMIRDYLQSDSKLLGSYGLSYRLLGFDSKKKTLRPPGSQGQTFNCFHAIISFVQGEIDCNSEERSVCLDIIYLLCSDPETSAATLRFLRTSYELISSYLSRILLDRQLIYQNLGEVGRFWRILATEIKHTNDANLRSHCSSYVKLLLGDSGLSKPTELVSEHVFVHEQPDMPTWEFFDGTELWKTLSECSNVEGSIDVKLLHQKLLNEVRQLGPQLGTVQANLIQQEIKHILAYTSKLNASKDELNEKLGYFEGWRELVEVMVIVPCLNVFEDGSRVVILLELIHELLLIASSPKSSPLFLNPISSVMMISASRVLTCKPDTVSKTQIIATAKAIANLLEVPSSSEIWSTYKRARANLYASLLYLLMCLPTGSLMDFKLSHRLLEKLCKDTLSGQELVKVLATSVLTVDETAGWVNDLASDGSLRLLVGSLAVDDKEIKASKYERYSKAFYSFDSKIALLLKIASTQNGARMLIHARIVDVLSKLECVEMYPFVVNQNEVCAKLFQNVIRLMNTIASSTLQRDYEHLSQFIGVRSSEFYDLLRLSHSFDQSEEVKSIITLVTSLLSRLILHANGQLQRLLIGSLNRHVEVNSKNDCLVITNILLACVKMSRNKAGLAIFAPSWERLDSSVALGQPTLGSLVYIVDSCLDKPSAESHLFISVIESSLYLIWHHLNLNYNVTEVTDENFGDIQRLKHKAADVMSDAFFAKLQSSIQENPYVDALIRRIKRIVHLSTDTTTSSSYF